VVMLCARIRPEWVSLMRSDGELSSCLAAHRLSWRAYAVSLDVGVGSDCVVYYAGALVSLHICDLGR